MEIGVHGVLIVLAPRLAKQVQKQELKIVTILPLLETPWVTIVMVGYHGNRRLAPKIVIRVHAQVS